MHQSSLLKKRKVGPLEKIFNLENRDNLKALIARMFYSSELPFNLARNPYYVNSYPFVANHMLNEKTQVERLLKPIKSTWNAKGVSIVSNGWKNIQRRHLINFMAISEGGPIFLKAINVSDEIKNKHYMANKMIEVIKEVGEQNVVQIITDNAHVCKGARMIVEISFPKFFWTS
uniref:DUF659 domain-containing protein n=1 Tax=Cajanus cajan TaxID=3821 RepID=A0A151RD14_CAJCA|nr:hypothetical protein KK1_038197 [Cajanus cajan]